MQYKIKFHHTIWNNSIDMKYWSKLRKGWMHDVPLIMKFLKFIRWRTKIPYSTVKFFSNNCIGKEYYINIHYIRYLLII